MKGDFSRITFNPTKQFSRVLMQQGRVQVDADWNEQVSILLHYLRTLATDLIGQHGGPTRDGFKVVSCLAKNDKNEDVPIDCAALEEPNPQNTFYILPGHYYVNGILCDNEDWYEYEDQPHCSPAAPDLQIGKKYLVYLDVWERHITYIEDEDQNRDDPGIREVALGGPDTATRAQVIWQIKVSDETIDDSLLGLALYSAAIEKIGDILSNVTYNITQLQWLADEALLLLSNQSPSPENSRTLEEVLSEIKTLLDELYTDDQASGQVSYVTQLNNLSNELPPDQMVSFKRHLLALTGLINSTDLPQPSEDPMAIGEDFQTNLDMLTRRIQALMLEISNLNEEIEANKKAVEQWLQDELKRVEPKLKAKAAEDPNADTDPCTIPPEARYRGLENQLYRVEVHQGSNNGSTSTFKWSRENGSVVFPIELVQGQVVTLKHLGRDGRLGLQVGDWVEVVDDDYTLEQRAESLLQVEDIDPITKEVRLSASPASNVGQAADKHPLLRRWDHRAGDPVERGLELRNGAAVLKEGTEETGWLKLEDGVEIQFQPPLEATTPNEYRTGDYWLIPARTATGDVEWPGPKSEPDGVGPDGVTHHHAPLAIIEKGYNKIEVLADCRRLFTPLGMTVGE